MIIKKYISEVKSLIDYFYKIKHTYIKRKLVSKIFNHSKFYLVFYYYQDSLFDVSISLEYSKYSKDIIRIEKFINLEAPLNSSILSKTLEKGSQIKQLIFSNRDDDAIDDPDFHISLSNNTLTIDWFEINSESLNILLELGPGLILRLKNLKKYDEFWDLDLIQRFLSYCRRSPPCCKLSFSKVVIDLDLDNKYYLKFIESNESLSELKHLIDSLLKIYDVEFENISYDDLFINRTDYFKKYIGRLRDEYNNAKLKFERTLKYKRIECYLDDFFNNKDDCIYQTIEELKLKEFEFYANEIHMDRYD